jgi:DMSO reductase anchor subunit
MSILAMWYQTSREGQQFLAGRDVRVAVAVVGVVVAYTLLRTRRRLAHPVSWGRTVGRWVVAAALAASVWMGIDLVRAEDWLVQLRAIVPQLNENGIRYLVLIAAGWLGWTVAFSEGFRRIAAVPQPQQAAPSSDK